LSHWPFDCCHFNGFFLTADVKPRPIRKSIPPNTIPICIQHSANDYLRPPYRVPKLINDSLLFFFFFLIIGST
ncbi:hypothetical protein CW304_32205, partial [Bacillus sp. UFRGS-B20]